MAAALTPAEDIPGVLLAHPPAEVIDTRYGHHARSWVIDVRAGSRTTVVVWATGLAAALSTPCDPPAPTR